MLFDVNVDTIDDVLIIRKAVIDQLKNGGTILLEWSSENTSVRKALGLPLKLLMAETLMFLKVADPDTYGRIVTRTRPNFYAW